MVDVGILSNFDAQSGPASTNGSTCSSTRCHGGQTSPAWLTGSINVDTQCTSCHALGTSQYNSYNSGFHSLHQNQGIACVDCHNTSTLQTGHFINLEITTFEQAPIDTVGGGTTLIPSGYTGTCNFSCHGKDHQNEDWFGGG